MKYYFPYCRWNVAFCWYDIKNIGGISTAQVGFGIGWNRIGFFVIVAPCLWRLKSSRLSRALLEIKFLRAFLVSLRLLKILSYIKNGTELKPQTLSPSPPLLVFSLRVPPRIFTTNFSPLPPIFFFFLLPTLFTSHAPRIPREKKAPFTYAQALRFKVDLLSISLPLAADLGAICGRKIGQGSSNSHHLR